VSGENRGVCGKNRGCVTKMCKRVVKMKNSDDKKPLLVNTFLTKLFPSFFPLDIVFLGLGHLGSNSLAKYWDWMLATNCLKQQFKTSEQQF
jgi:hypothetical protein